SVSSCSNPLSAFSASLWSPRSLCSKSAFVFLCADLWYLCVRTLASLLEHPFVVRQPIDRPLNRLANSQLRSPAGFSHLGCIQKDERIITDPAPFSTGKIQCRSYLESLTDPRDRVFHRTVLFGAEIINFAPVLCRSRCLFGHDM